MAAELRGDADAALLDPIEAAYCTAFAPRRIADFSAGRLCARLALEQLGIEGFPIAINPDRTPRWPPGVTGSISHTTGYGCAVAANEFTVGSIGIDAELAGRVTPQLDRLVFTARESRWLGALSVNDRRFASTIIFSAKEAFYKCQYPVTRRWLEFVDASIEIASSDLRSGTFTVDTAYDALDLGAEVRLPLRGRFTTDGELVLTGIALR